MLADRMTKIWTEDFNLSNIDAIEQMPFLFQEKPLKRQMMAQTVDRSKLLRHKAVILPCPKVARLPASLVRPSQT